MTQQALSSQNGAKKMKAALDKKRFGPWALVTGASSGIGKEFARQIAASGIHVALVGRRESLLRTVGAECTRVSSVQDRIIPLDLSEPDFLPVLADATRDLDIGLVVSNAGTGNPGSFIKKNRDDLLIDVRPSGAVSPLRARPREAWTWRDSSRWSDGSEPRGSLYGEQRCG
jgi:NADP-dependent 3-hydroxy acid dehydrogenase YdfG